MLKGMVGDSRPRSGTPAPATAKGAVAASADGAGEPEVGMMVPMAKVDWVSWFCQGS
jgi:hypothetical protein